MVREFGFQSVAASVHCPNNYPSGSWVESPRNAENLAVPGGGILVAAIGVMDQAGRGRLSLDGHGQGSGGEFAQPSKGAAGDRSSSLGSLG